MCVSFFFKRKHQIFIYTSTLCQLWLYPHFQRVSEYLASYGHARYRLSILGHILSELC
jgi:hypothetical protein